MRTTSGSCRVSTMSAAAIPASRSSSSRRSRPREAGSAGSAVCSDCGPSLMNSLLPTGVATSHPWHRTPWAAPGGSTSLYQPYSCRERRTRLTCRGACDSPALPAPRGGWVEEDFLAPPRLSPARGPPQPALDLDPVAPVEVPSPPTPSTRRPPSTRPRSESPGSHQIDRFPHTEPCPPSVIITLDPAVPPDPSYRKQPKRRFGFPIPGTKAFRTTAL